MSDTAAAEHLDDVNGERPPHEPSFLNLEWSAEDPCLVATFRPRKEHRGPPGFLHGGLAAACLDETMASVSTLLDGRPSVTATLDVKFRKPVPLDGRPVRIEAWREVAETKRRQKVHGRLLTADGVVCVEASGLFILPPES